MFAFESTRDMRYFHLSFSNDDNRTWNERPMYYNQNKNTTHKKNYFYFHKTNGWMVSYI